MPAGSEYALPPDWEESWNAARRRIDNAGYGALVAEAYRRHGAELALKAGPKTALRLASTISEVAIRGGKRAAAIVPEAASIAARHLGGEPEVLGWLETIENAARTAPRSIADLLECTARLLSSLDFQGYTAFVRMGIAIGRKDSDRQGSFFRLEDAEARQFIEREAGQAGFLALETGLKHYLTAIWGIRPPIREVPRDTPDHLRRRPGFGNGVIRLPSSFPGFSAEDTKRLYRAALAHIGAHNRFTTRIFPVGKLKQLQIAVISLVEDARVERLAMSDMPGLKSLWLPFHVARPGGAPLAVTLLARLSRALIDPDYQDPDGWVEKGRLLFEEAARQDLADQQLSRRIGGLLGNDLGQMRLQFDAKTYVVQPAYRDDNLGIWDFGEQPEQAVIEMEQMIEGARVEQRQSDEGRPDQQNQEQDPEAAANRVSLKTEDQSGMLVARYPEFDYVTGRERPEWCSVKEYPPHPASAEALARLQDERADVVNRLTTLIRSSRISRQQRVRRQPEGEFIDIDACIDATISRRMGETPDSRVHGRYERRNRDLSVLVLLDVSKSTADPVQGGAGSVLDVERLSTALIAHAMAELGDPFAIAAFCSETREDVHYIRVKDFGRPYDAFARTRLAGLTSGLSTRLGAAIRHAGNDLRRQQTYRRLLLVVTDGEPSDVDVDDSRYLVEDARAALHALNRDGMDVFCVALDSKAESYAGYIFGARNAVWINSVERLPERLPALLFNLTR